MPAEPPRTMSSSSSASRTCPAACSMRAPTSWALTSFDAGSASAVRRARSTYGSSVRVDRPRAPGTRHSGMVDAAEVARDPLPSSSRGARERQLVPARGAVDDRGEDALGCDQAILDLLWPLAAPLREPPLALGDDRLVRVFAHKLVSVPEFAAVDARADQRHHARPRPGDRFTPLALQRQHPLLSQAASNRTP
jgi:hypothetical protein